MAGRAPSQCLYLLTRQRTPGSLSHHTLRALPSTSFSRGPRNNRTLANAAHVPSEDPSHFEKQLPHPIPPGTITPAPPIDFDLSTLPSPSASQARLVPASPSYFTTKPATTDDHLHLQRLLRAYQTLPTLPPGEAPRASWKKLVAYRLSVGEEVPAARHRRIMRLCARLNLIVPDLMPAPVKEALDFHRRPIDPLAGKRRQEVIDEWGRGLGRGKRKSASVQAWLVEGEGRVLVNGKSLNQVFARMHDRESALWPLVALGRMARYNVWAKCGGGGTTGWAEAMAMAVGRALLVHEPALKPALRRAGVIRRDPRRVERKKPGHVKARKMPTWVKR